VEKYHAQYDVFDGDTRARVLGRPATEDPVDSLVGDILAANRELPLAERFSVAEFALWVGEHFNQRLDRMAMAASVEGRVPFQDNSVVDLALAMPIATKLRGGRGKAPLRAAFESLVPQFVSQRPKRPFAAPATAWLKGALRPVVQDALSPQSLAALPVFDRQGLSAVFSLFPSGLPERQEQVWSLLNLVLWWEGFHRLATRSTAGTAIIPGA
jgi:asparagine synthase (glutamine-hydrolysing)